ncbi:MAG: alginate export family protein [Rhodocyclaceae bacterium]|nr:alginate export family protein [Rhodocyclaceae bacterium]
MEASFYDPYRYGSGSACRTGTLKTFNPLYASSNYLGEGQFLGLSNLLMITPGFAASPTSKANLAIEYGFARRIESRDAAYAAVPALMQALRPHLGMRSVACFVQLGLGRQTNT